MGHPRYHRGLAVPQIRVCSPSLSPELRTLGANTSNTLECGGHLKAGPLWPYPSASLAHWIPHLLKSARLLPTPGPLHLPCLLPPIFLFQPESSSPIESFPDLKQPPSLLLHSCQSRLTALLVLTAARNHSTHGTAYLPTVSPLPLPAGHTRTHAQDGGDFVLSSTAVSAHSSLNNFDERKNSLIFIGIKMCLRDSTEQFS